MRNAVSMLMSLASDGGTDGPVVMTLLSSGVGGGGRGFGVSITLGIGGGGSGGYDC